MRKKTAVLITSLGLILPAAVACAQTAGGPASGQWYSVPETDLSYRMLRAIFGSVVDSAATLSFSGGGGGQTVAGALFGVVNIVLLAAVAGIMCLSVAVGVVHTARRGTWFGQRYDGFWGPLRGAVSLGMLMPVAGGYSLVQVAVLACALQGIGLANAAYGALLSALGSGTQMTASVSLAPAPTQTAALALARDVLLDLTCAARVPALAPSDNASMSQFSTTGAGSISWGCSDGSCLPNTCGSVAYATPSASDAAGLSSALSGLTGSATADQISAAVLSGQQRGLEQMITDLQPLAGQIASGWPAGSALPDGSAAIQQAAADYVAAVQQAIQSAAVGAPDSGSASSLGWASAGAYYWRLRNLQASASGAAATIPLAVVPVAADLDGELGSGYASDLGLVMGQALHVAVNAGAPEPAPVSRASGLPARELARLEHLVSGVASATTTAASGLAAWASGRATIAGEINTLLASSLGSGDVLASLQAIGSTLLSLGVAAVTGGVAASLIPGVGLGSLGVMVGFALIMVGSELCVVLPLLPAILWIMAVLAVIVSIVEAMVAAPLWAAAHAMPSGEGWAGRWGGTGYRLLLAVILRPVLSIAGLAIGYALLETMAWLAGQLLAPALSSAFQGSGPGMVEGLIAALVVVSTIMYLAYRSLSLCLLIPDAAMRWVEVSAGGWGERHADAADTASSAARSGAVEARGVAQAIPNTPASPGGSGGGVPALASAAPAELAGAETKGV